MLSIGERHPVYGEVVAVGVRDGEGYYMFTKGGVVSLMPRDLIDAARVSR